MNKVLLFGKNGLLGSEFYKVFQARGIEFFAPERGELDLLDYGAVRDIVANNKPSKIILCAAYTDVEKAENEEQELCKRMNVGIVENLLKTKVPIVHFSTDYVFGHFDYGMEIEEELEREPLNFYGKTKQEAEKLLEKSGVLFWNIRTSWLFGEGGKNFVSAILEASQKNEKLRIIHDQVGRPTYAKDLASFVCENFILKKQPFGHYHLQNSGKSVSWAEFAEYFLGKTGWKGAIEQIKSSEWTSSVERPKNSVLKNTKLDEGMRDWKKAVDEFL